MIAFEPAPPGGHHPAPWVAATGGYGFDINIEIEVAEKDLSTAMLLVSSLLKLKVGLSVRLVAVSIKSFCDRNRHSNFQVMPQETAAFFNLVAKPDPILIDESTLEWISAHWQPTRALVNENPRFRTLLQALSSLPFSKDLGLSMIDIWGSLQALLSQAHGESSLRLSTQLSSYLEPPGLGRKRLADKISDLYQKRGKMAHGSKKIDLDAVNDSMEIAMRVAIRIIEHGEVPTSDNLKDMLYGV